MKSSMKRAIAAILIAVSLTACQQGDQNNSLELSGGTSLPDFSAAEEGTGQDILPSAFQSAIDPETFSVTLSDKEIAVSLPGVKRTVADLEESNGRMSWRYPEDEIAVQVTQYPSYLDVGIRYGGDANQEADFTWPLVSGQDYTLPIGEGKHFPANDPVWLDYLGGKEWEVIESFSMSFAAAGYGDTAVVYILPQNFNNEIVFSGEASLEFSLRHTYPTVNPEKSYHLRIYVTDNNPVAIAKVYKSYVEETTGIKTLAEKAQENPNIEKLYGAPHIYLFDQTVLSEEDVNWQAFRESLDTPQLTWIRTFAEKELEDSVGFLSTLEEIRGQDYVGAYQKQVITQGLSQLLLLPDFYNSEAFPVSDDYMQSLNLLSRYFTRTEEIARNKHVLAANLTGVFQPVEGWADDRTVDLIEAMYDAGIGNAWIGLNHWEQASIKPELTQSISDKGWLVGTYDSYHSVHEPGQEQWLTAAFPQEVYNEYAVQTKDGGYVEGFNAVGRKFNPTLSLPYVRERVNGILQNEVTFNSWFVDCDATGEIYDDYSPSHMTTMQQDYDARLERMETISSEWDMVVGSEGGNDYAANTIAFAHGIELQTFSWMDEDMKSNQDSEYYIGRWYAGNGGAPEHFIKQIPIKEKYRSLFLNPAYNVPLYKLVYNNAVITSYHWDWSTLKIQDEVENRMMYEMLYNVPPMFHLDKFQWEEHGELIAAHVSQWSELSKRIINLEMTNFAVLSTDRLVQSTVYGDNVQIIANFSNSDFSYDGIIIQAGDCVVLEQ